MKAWSDANREKVRAYSAKYRANNKNKEKSKAQVRAHGRRKMGFPTQPRPEPSVCECCGGPPGKRSMHLDHDHVTGKFRGWLCGKCNVGIGAMGDTIAGVESALRYLQKNTS